MIIMAEKLRSCENRILKWCNNLNASLLFNFLKSCEGLPCYSRFNILQVAFLCHRVRTVTHLNKRRRQLFNIFTCDLKGQLILTVRGQHWRKPVDVLSIFNNIFVFFPIRFWTSLKQCDLSFDPQLLHAFSLLPSSPIIDETSKIG